VQKIVLKGYKRGEKPITCRAADALEPELEKAKEATKGIAKDIGDVLIYALYPTTGMRFLKWKYGLEAPPPEVKPKTLNDVKREDELLAKLKAGKLAESAEKQVPAAPVKGTGGRTFRVSVGNEVYTVGVEAVGAPPPAAPVKEKAPPVAPAPAKAPPAVAKGKEVTITAPMPGIIIRYEVKVGDKVEAEDVIVILEAMKMANAITTPVGGRVKAINFASGDKVARDDVLAIIG
jgi:pyruvate carboxylase subunit B